MRDEDVMDMLQESVLRIVHTAGSGRAFTVKVGLFPVESRPLEDFLAAFLQVLHVFIQKCDRRPDISVPPKRKVGRFFSVG